MNLYLGCVWLIFFWLVCCRFVVMDLFGVEEWRELVSVLGVVIDKEIGEEVEG